MRERLVGLSDRYRLPPAAIRRLGELTRLLVTDAAAPTAIHEPIGVVDHHLADSLVALEVDTLRGASQVVDIGSGAGMPALPLAIARPQAEFVLLESAARKCAFLERAVQACELGNVEIVNARAELYATDGRAFDVATARAVASLDVLAEYAAPLLSLGGTLVAWSGKRSPEVEAAAGRASEELGLTAPEAVRVAPFPAARHRHLYLMSKVRPTPARFPRRPGMALKRPLGTPLGAPRLGARGPSDRPRR